MAASALLRLLLAACALVAARAAGRGAGGGPAARSSSSGANKCFQQGELCARSFVYTPCCPGLTCKGQSGYDVNAKCV